MPLQTSVRTSPPPFAGVLEMLTRELSSGKMRSASAGAGNADPPNDMAVTKTIQTSFDLLGEMLKFNPLIFQAFDALLTPERRQVLMQVGGISLS
eukprot:COSAG03_NODE_1346_length_4284_cov_516.917324_1_plen_94_part_10